MARKRDYAAERARRRERAGDSTEFYRLRVDRARKRYGKNLSLRAARGHGNADEKEAMRLIRLIPKLDPETMFTFTGLADRPGDGTWQRARFDVLEPAGRKTRTVQETTFIVGPPGHYLLPNVARTLKASGWAALGAQYLSKMADNNIPVGSGAVVGVKRGEMYVEGEYAGDFDERNPIKTWKRRRK